MMSVTRVRISGNDNSFNEDRETLVLALKAFREYYKYDFDLKTPLSNMCGRAMLNVAWFLKFEIQMDKAGVAQKRGEIHPV